MNCRPTAPSATLQPYSSRSAPGARACFQPRSSSVASARLALSSCRLPRRSAPALPWLSTCTATTPWKACSNWLIWATPSQPASSTTTSVSVAVRRKAAGLADGRASASGLIAGRSPRACASVRGAAAGPDGTATDTPNRSASRPATLSSEGSTTTIWRGATWVAASTASENGATSVVKTPATTRPATTGACSST